ncbi:MAG: hypothetical protein PHP22_10405 [Oscillospiraceae bacterium]|nr:hypothetical protein [Oscillospiraceae bacterium]
MNEKIRELKKCYQKLFGKEIWNDSYIKVTDKDEILLSANKKGLLLLIEALINLCGKDLIGSHYHLDEAGMANKCEKPMIITLVETPGENDW